MVLQNNFNENENENSLNNENDEILTGNDENNENNEDNGYSSGNDENTVEYAYIDDPDPMELRSGTKIKHPLLVF